MRFLRKKILIIAKISYFGIYQVNGVKFYGASNHPLPSYPFYTARGQEMQYAWSKIPADTDVLITHTPPLGSSICKVIWNGNCILASLAYEIS